MAVLDRVQVLAGHDHVSSRRQVRLQIGDWLTRGCVAEDEVELRGCADCCGSSEIDANSVDHLRGAILVQNGGLGSAQDGDVLTKDDVVHCATATELTVECVATG